MKNIRARQLIGETVTERAKIDSIDKRLLIDKIQKPVLLVLKKNKNLINGFDDIKSATWDKAFLAFFKILQS